MAGRNRKNSAEYFSHDVDASSDEKIIYLESKFGHTGYAVYFKFLERMARSDDFAIDWNDIKKAIYAAEFHISVTEIEQIITECCRQEIKAFEIKNGKLFSNGLKKRMQPLLDKREYNRKKYEERKAKKIKALENSETEKDISVTETTQSKGKERKVKESKVYNIYPPTPQRGGSTSKKKKSGSKYQQLKTALSQKIKEKNLIDCHDKLFEFFEYRMALEKKHKYKTPKGLDALVGDVAACIAAGLNPVDCLDEAMRREWLTPKLDYFKNNFGKNNNSRRFPNGTMMGSNRMDGVVMACQQFVNEEEGAE